MLLIVQNELNRQLQYFFMSRITLLFIGSVLFYSCSIGQDSTVAITPKTLKEKIREGHFKTKDLVVLIDKSDYLVSVYHKDSLLITYPCVLGFNPTDDKRREGDGCTPEGTFKIRSKYPHRSWSYFIWIDYPNDDSWRKFKERKANGEIPADAKIGGEIGIHGVPDEADFAIDQGTNWTLGCISLKTSHIKDLYNSIGDDTIVEIVQ